MGSVPLYTGFANNIATIGVSGILGDASVGLPSRDIRYFDISSPVITPLTGMQEQAAVSNEEVRIPEPLLPVIRKSLLKRILDRLNGVPRDEIHKLTEVQFREFLGARRHFGVTYDNKGHWLYSPGHKDIIISHLGVGRVKEHQWGILELRVEGRVDPVLLFSEETEIKAERQVTSKLVFDSLVAPDLPEAAIPIVFYLEGMDNDLREGANNIKPGASQWAVALRNLGYPIVFTNSLQSFEATVRRHKPFIVLVSATQDHMPFAVKAYDIAKNIDPGIVVGLGGPGSIQEAAGLFDFVGIGEYYMALPRILRELITMKNEGVLKTGSSTPWREIIERLTSDKGLRESAIADMGDRNNFLPVLDGSAAERLLEVSARRYFSTESGDYSVDFPVSYDPIAGAKLFIRTDGGIVASKVDSYDNSIVPPHILSPMLSGTEEFDRLSGAYYPSNADANTGFPFLFPSLYAQHGCKSPEERCNFCSILSPIGGRSPSIGQLLKVMLTSVVFGHDRFIYDDDRFIQSARWVKEWAEGVIQLGLQKYLRIRVQTRADGISDDIMELLRVKLGLSFVLGIETMSPSRAENTDGLRKVKKGRGKKYYDDVKHTLTRLAKNPIDGDRFFIIAVSPGDKIADVAEDIYNQLLIIEELWSRHSYVPDFSYNIRQMPYYGDRVTAGLAGFERAQPGSILPGLSEGKVKIGKIIGNFLPFGVDIVGQALMTFGMFIPKDFEWPTALGEFIEVASMSGEMTLESILSGVSSQTLNIGDLVRALENVHRNSKKMTSEDRACLSVWLGQILPLYERLKERLGERVMSKKERQGLKAEKMRSYGQIPGTTTM